MKELTKAQVQKTLRDAKDFNLEIEVVCCMLEELWYNKDISTDTLLDVAIMKACRNAKKEWDV